MEIRNGFLKSYSDSCAYITPFCTAILVNDAVLFTFNLVNKFFLYESTVSELINNLSAI